MPNTSTARAAVLGTIGTDATLVQTVQQTGSAPKPSALSLMRAVHVGDDPALLKKALVWGFDDQLGWYPASFKRFENKGNVAMIAWLMSYIPKTKKLPLDHVLWNPESTESNFIYRGLCVNFECPYDNPPQPRIGFVIGQAQAHPPLWRVSMVHVAGNTQCNVPISNLYIPKGPYTQFVVGSGPTGREHERCVPTNWLSFDTEDIRRVTQHLDKAQSPKNVQMAGRLPPPPTPERKPKPKQNKIKRKSANARGANARGANAQGAHAQGASADSINNPAQGSTQNLSSRPALTNDVHRAAQLLTNMYRGTQQTAGAGAGGGGGGGGGGTQGKARQQQKRKAPMSAGSRRGFMSSSGIRRGSSGSRRGSSGSRRGFMSGSGSRRGSSGSRRGFMSGSGSRRGSSGSRRGSRRGFMSGSRSGSRRGLPRYLSSWGTPSRRQPRWR